MNNLYKKTTSYNDERCSYGVYLHQPQSAASFYRKTNSSLVILHTRMYSAQGQNKHQAPRRPKPANAGKCQPPRQSVKRSNSQLTASHRFVPFVFTMGVLCNWCHVFWNSKKPPDLTVSAFPHRIFFYYICTSFTYIYLFFFVTKHWHCHFLSQIIQS